MAVMMFYGSVSVFFDIILIYSDDSDKAPGSSGLVLALNMFVHSNKHRTVDFLAARSPYNCLLEVDFD